MKKRILITDDSKSCLIFNAEIIHQIYLDSTEIVLAQSATEALELINENISNPFSLIITDLQMETDYEPMCAGEWLIEELKKINTYKNTPVIIISGMPNISKIAEKYNVNYISKNQLVNNKELLKLTLEKIL